MTARTTSERPPLSVRRCKYDVPYGNEAMFAPHIAGDTHEKRDYHNERLRVFCHEQSIPLADICSHLRDEHLGDELHPNEAGARIIAERVFEVLRTVHSSGRPTENIQ